MNLTNEILLFNHFLIMYDFVFYCIIFILYCTHVQMSYVLNSYLLTYMRVMLSPANVPTWWCPLTKYERRTQDFILGM